MSLRTVAIYTLHELGKKSIQLSKNMTKNITDDFVLFSGVVVPAGEKYDCSYILLLSKQPTLDILLWLTSSLQCRNWGVFIGTIRVQDDTLKRF